MHRPLSLCLALAVLALPSLAQTAVAIVADRDNTLYEDANGAVSNGAGNGFFVGINGLGDVRRGVLSFDLTGTIPAGATVLTATLDLRLEMGSTMPLAISAHRLLAAWGEGTSTPGLGGGGAGGPATSGDATWIHTFFSTSFWSSPGGDFVTAPGATTMVMGPANYLWSGPGITQDVQSWVDQPATNHGWILVSPEVTTGLAKRFASRETQIPVLRPMLRVTYATALVTDLGLGCNGLQLTNRGLPVVGNATFGLDVAVASPGASVAAFLALGVAPNPLLIDDGAGPCFYALDLTTTLAFIDAGLSPLGPIAADGAGQASLGFPIPPVPDLAGFVLEVQALAIGPTLSSSNALRVAIAP